MLRRILPLALSALLIPGAATAGTRKAEDASKLEKAAANLDRQADNAGDRAAFKALSERLSIPVATLESQKKSTSFGFGQLFIANALATASGKTFDQIAGEFRGGKGWGEIAHENDLKLGRVVSDLKRADKEIKEERKEIAHDQRAGKGSGEHASQRREPQGRNGMAEHGRGMAKRRGRP